MEFEVKYALYSMHTFHTSICGLPRCKRCLGASSLGCLWGEWLHAVAGSGATLASQAPRSTGQAGAGLRLGAWAGLGFELAYDSLGLAGAGLGAWLWGWLP